MNIKISNDINQRIANIHFGCIKASVKIDSFNKELWDIILLESEKIKAKIHSNYEISQISTVKATREAYKKTGKDPSRYRPSAESLIKRIISGKELYQINNVVDIINLISFKTGFSIGGYDFEKISGEILFDIGKNTDVYEGLGRGVLNIEELPIFRDSLGAFGCPTSDSIRTGVTENTTSFLMIIMNFDGVELLQESIDETVSLLKKYAYSNDIQEMIF